jgi:hypothetical protein
MTNPYLSSTARLVTKMCKNVYTFYFGFSSQKKRQKEGLVLVTRIERAIFALQVRRLTTWPNELI